MRDGHIDVQLVAAITVAVIFIRYWRRIMAVVVGAVVALSVVGLITVISWLDAWPQR